MDYTKTCWFCGGDTMVPKGNYCQCSKDGATWNEQPTLGIYDDIKVSSRTPDPGTMFRPWRHRGFFKGGAPLKPLLRPSDKGYKKEGGKE